MTSQSRFFSVKNKISYKKACFPPKLSISQLPSYQWLLKRNLTAKQRKNPIAIISNESRVIKKRRNKKKLFFCKIDKKTLYFLSLTDFYTDNLHNYGFSILDKSVGNWILHRIPLQIKFCSFKIDEVMTFFIGLFKTAINE